MSEDESVCTDEPAELLRRLGALPAARPLLEALRGLDGVYLVGGAVRDLLLGGAPPDLDLVFEGEVSELAGRLGGHVRLHDRFGTGTVVLDGFSYDLARSRREHYPAPGALPEVEAAPIEVDLQRRDFSVNAIALALGGASAGRLLAVSGACDDLRLRRLRVLHERSFLEDPTRLLRLARYRARLGFAVEAHTRALAQRAVTSGALQTVSGARTGAEVRLLAGEADPLCAFAAVHELGLDRAVHPGLGLEDAELARRAIELLPAGHRHDRLMLAAAAMAIPAAELRGLLQQLGYPASDREVIAAAAVRARSLARRLEAARKPSEIARSLCGAEPELIALAGALGPVAQARRWRDELRHVGLSISGEDLLAIGVPQGEAVGRGLRAALAAKLDGIASDRDAELRIAVAATRQESE